MKYIYEDKGNKGKDEKKKLFVMSRIVSCIYI